MGINDYIQVGSRIKEYRKKKGIKQKEIASKLGIPISTYANYENNHREPTMIMLDSIAELLETTVGKLIGFDSFNVFVDYLKSIDYDVKIEKADESNTGHWEEMKDDEGNVIEEVWIAEKETHTITISKDKLSISFNEEGFQQFRENIEKSIEFEIFKANQGK